jgi:hypothetical protein
VAGLVVAVRPFRRRCARVPPTGWLLIAPADGWATLLAGQAAPAHGLLASSSRRDLMVAVLRVRGRLGRLRRRRGGSTRQASCGPVTGGPRRCCRTRRAGCCRTRQSATGAGSPRRSGPTSGPRAQPPAGGVRGESTSDTCVAGPHNPATGEDSATTLRLVKLAFLRCRGGCAVMTQVPVDGPATCEVMVGHASLRCIGNDGRRAGLGGMRPQAVSGAFRAHRTVFKGGLGHHSVAFLPRLGGSCGGR